MRIFLLCLTLSWGSYIRAQSLPTNPPESSIVREYLLALDQDLILFLDDNPVAPDNYTYLRPLEGIRQEATWLLIPFVPESFGISQQSDHLVFGYLYREKQQINSNHTLPIIFLLEDYTACKSLHIRIKTHFLINSNN